LSRDFLPCARKMSATSAVGRLILPFWVGRWALRPALKWEDLQSGYSQPVGDVGISADRWLSIPDRHDRVKLGSSSDRSHVPTGASPNCDAEYAAIPSSE